MKSVSIRGFEGFYNRLILVALVITVAGWGCGKDEVVRRYKAPKDPPISRSRQTPSDGASSPEALRGMFQYERPPGWIENPASGVGRVLEFRAGDGGSVLITLSILPDSAGGLLPNINRWRNQVGLPPMNADAAEKLVRPISLWGKEGHYVELVGDEQGILCAFLLGPPYSVFLKLIGPSPSVERERLTFEEFARALKVKKHDG